MMVFSSFFSIYSVTNYFLVNLSVADLLVTLVCMPMAMSQQVSVIWFYGLFMCKFSAYLQGKHAMVAYPRESLLFHFHFVYFVVWGWEKERKKKLSSIFSVTFYQQSGKRAKVSAQWSSFWCAYIKTRRVYSHPFLNAGVAASSSVFSILAMSMDR